MDFKTLIEKISLHYAKNLPFVVFSLPDSEIISSSFQNNDKAYVDNTLSQDGFVLSPFNSELKSLFIPKEVSEIHYTSFKFTDVISKHVEILESENDKISYEKLIHKTIDAIQNGSAGKIVVSRKKELTLPYFSIESLIERLFSAYPTAFRYIWYHPETGLWCGATPETLVEIKNNEFKTMALAGTQTYATGKVVWRKKELEEQYFVTQAILNNLKGIVENVNVSEIQNHQAGSLLHLRTDISGKLKSGNGVLSKVAETLHPTPAVCGTPREFARDFIIKNEGYSREFYTGFLGSIEDKGTSANLMVNLRCMKIQNGMATIFVGGGITKDSVPEEEWGETQNKMQTMLQVLHPML